MWQLNHGESWWIHASQCIAGMLPASLHVARHLLSHRRICAKGAGGRRELSGSACQMARGGLVEGLDFFHGENGGYFPIIWGIYSDSILKYLGNDLRYCWITLVCPPPMQGRLFASCAGILTNSVINPQLICMRCTIHTWKCLWPFSKGRLSLPELTFLDFLVMIRWQVYSRFKS